MIDPGAIDAVLRCYRGVLGGFEPAAPTVRLGYPHPRLAGTGHNPVDRPGFSGAIVERVETENGTNCLRGWPPGVDDPGRIFALHDLLAHVRAQDIDYVAVPLRSDEGRTLVSSCGRLWQLEPWLPGCADFWSRPTDARLAAAFVALARFHDAARTFEPTGGGQSQRPAKSAIAPTVLDRIERIARWTPQRIAEVSERLAQRYGAFPRAVSEDAVARAALRIVGAFAHCAGRLDHELHTAAGTIVPLQPCLRDVWHDHVLFRDDEVTGLIDPSAARTDTVAADISRLAGSLIADDRRAWAVALDAYQSIRPLSAAEARLVGVLDRSGVLLSGMAWLERSEFWSERSAQFRARLLERLERIADRAEVLAQSIE
jgi:Ser/Thr protein kinase RdoA (MazF antagonist)